MGELFARKALLPAGWADNVKFEIDAGVIAAVASGVDLPADAAGAVVPGIGNAHSHAFQRALAGRAEYGTGEDTFWTWRHEMYALSARLDADALEAIASQLYAEMLCAGYTSVVEFHYLHRARGETNVSGSMLDALLRAAGATGTVQLVVTVTPGADLGPYDNAATASASSAAGATGIRLVYAPVLYERADFDQPTPTPEQARFAMSVDEYLAHVEWALDRVAAPNRVALAAHSLRAVSPESLTAIAERSESLTLPLHIHVAEQQREVEGSLAHLGARPVQWLLDNQDVSARWTLVHATHLDERECDRLADSGASVALCPSTEGNLGDGLFPLEDFLRKGGSIAIGSDSHVTVDPFEELRWLEYGQRLSGYKRNVAAVRSGHTGRDLFDAARNGGARAAGLSGNGLEPGAVADLLVLDTGHSALVGHGVDTLLDALVFSAQGNGSPVLRVMVNGEWCVSGGRHRDGEAIRDRYAAAIRSLQLAAVKS